MRSGHFAYWDDIAVVHDGVRTVSGGHGFAGIGRKQMLILLQARARDLGVDLQFETEFKSAEEYRRTMIWSSPATASIPPCAANMPMCSSPTSTCACASSSGWARIRNSTTPSPSSSKRPNMAGSGPCLSVRRRYRDLHRGMHAGNLGQDLGFADMSKEDTVAYCERIFANHLGGHALMSNAAHLRGSAVWMNFPRVICERWFHENVVLMGDAAATGHFSIGSGTRLAFDSAIALAEYLHSEPTWRRPFPAIRTNGGSRCCACNRPRATAWNGSSRSNATWTCRPAVRLFPADPQPAHQPRKPAPARPAWLARAEDWFQEQAGARRGAADVRALPPARHGAENRVVVSPMAQYKAVDGCPTDWHFAHYAERAKGGAGLVYTEMTCVSPRAASPPAAPAFMRRNMRPRGSG
jgi:anthraniloyl-CoA monooxygenase